MVCCTVQLARCSVNTWTSYYRDQFTHHTHNCSPLWTDNLKSSSFSSPTPPLSYVSLSNKQRWQAPGPEAFIARAPQYPKKSGDRVGTPLKWPHTKPYRVTHTFKLSEKGTTWGVQYQFLWRGSARAAPYLRVSPCSTYLAINCPALQIMRITYLHATAQVLLKWVIKHTSLQLPPRNTGHSEPADVPK